MFRPLSFSLVSCLVFAATAFAEPKAEEAGKGKGAEKAAAAADKAAAPAAKGAAPAAMPAVPDAPEVKKTVDAFVGNPSLAATLTAGPESDSFMFKIKCKKVSMGRAAACEMNAKSKKFGPFQMAGLVGYDTGRKAVHFMAITSDGEVHDHVCQWQSDEQITCELLKQIGPDGKPMTEDLKFTVTGGKVSGFDVAITGGHGPMTFTATSAKGKK